MMPSRSRLYRVGDLSSIKLARVTVLHSWMNEGSSLGQGQVYTELCHLFFGSRLVAFVWCHCSTFFYPMIVT